MYPTRVLCDSPCAAERLAHATEMISSLPAPAEILIVGASREAADDLVRSVSSRRGATFGLHPFSFTQLAARLAETELALAGIAPATSLSLQALVVLSAFRLHQSQELTYFAGVSTFPGFSGFLTQTLEELRLSGVLPEEIRSVAGSMIGTNSLETSQTQDRSAIELARLLEVVAEHLGDHRLADRSLVFQMATRAACRGTGVPWVGMPLVLLDVEVRWKTQADLIDALLSRAPQCLATVPEGDDATLRALTVGGGFRRVDHRVIERSSSLSRVQRYLFSDRARAAAEDSTVRVFSAPGESREAIEIARFILDEARAGTPFDNIAVFIRAPATYTPYLQTAFRRAGIPAYFARGTLRPDAAGRAFLALLHCASEGLSARRFAEYLSFAQVPDPGAEPAAVFAIGTDEILGYAADAARASGETADRADTEREGEEWSTGSDQGPVCAGSVCAPWKWESLLVEAAVIGGVARWRRRLDGLEAQLRLGLSEIESEEPDSARRLRLARDLAHLGHFKAFAIRIIEQLDNLPSLALWGDWLARLSALAISALRAPDRVLRVLAELQPLSAVGPVRLAQVCDTLARRLAFLEEDPPPYRYGRVFVGSVDLARGRSFSIVFVPGLAEGIFPQHPREDPLLPDTARQRISQWLETQEQRAVRERLLLRLAAGAARDRLYLSYPRIETLEGRARVPSFYGLDVARAVHGEIPPVERFERAADALSGARLSWPAPPEPHRAIDPVEHDLAVLRNLLHLRDPTAGKGRAQYLVELHPCLGRSLRSRFARWQRRSWSEFDGLVKANATVREILKNYRLANHAYSPSALESFAVCPYRFLLSSIHRLQPRSEVVPIEALDPLTRGGLFHETQAAVLRALKTEGLLPLTAARLDQGAAILSEVLDEIAARYYENLAPAIARVWEDEIRAIHADLLAWLQEMAHDTTWQPEHFELAFGMQPNPLHDPASVNDPVTVGEGFLLRGAVDLVERRTGGKTLRVTDHKTGRTKAAGELVTGGGRILQPVLYGLAVEQILRLPVEQARLFFCTARGGFAELSVRMDDRARLQAVSALKIIDDAIAGGMLPPCPVDGACRQCDFRVVCGPYEEERARRKDSTPLQSLTLLRRQL